MTDVLDPHGNLFLVRDSLAMVVYAMNTIQFADLDMMTRLNKAVVRRRQKAFIIIDLHTCSYEGSPE